MSACTLAVGTYFEWRSLFQVARWWNG